MPTKKTKSKKRSSIKPEPTTVKKGKIVEKITAAFHQDPDVKVILNEYLPTKGPGKRRREIDVLVVGNIAGYTMRLAFECKNEKKVIGSPKIDAFIGKLLDVGIPAQNGIFVSASGYTSGAIERAKEGGIKVLTLEGLTKEGLSSILYEAFQAVIFLLADITMFSITYKEEVRADEGEQDQAHMLFNERGDFYTFISDLVWDAWITAQLSLLLGEHPHELNIPSNIYHKINGKLVGIETISIKVRIKGLVMSDN